MRLGKLIALLSLAALLSAALAGLDQNAARGETKCEQKTAGLQKYVRELERTYLDRQYRANKVENNVEIERNKKIDKQCHIGRDIGGNAGSKECKEIDARIDLWMRDLRRRKKVALNFKRAFEEEREKLLRSLEYCKDVVWVPVPVPPGLPCPDFEGWKVPPDVICNAATLGPFPTFGPVPSAPAGSSAGGPKSPAAGGTGTTKTPSASGGECTQGNTLVGVGCVQ